MKSGKKQCYGCSNRHVGCHAECKEYQEYAAKRREVNKKALHAKEIEHAVYELNERNRRKQ